AGTETLRPGVVREDVRSDVPGEVGAALEAALALVEVDAESAVRAGAIGHVQDGRGRAVVLRTVLELIVLVVTRAAAQRQHFRDEVKVDRAEERGLLVAG